MKLGVATIQRNRGRYLAEWVSFHYLVGFTKFYIYLHKCTDDSERVLNILKGFFDIYVHIVPEDVHLPQLAVYKHAYSTFNHEIDWMAFIDGDEFLFSPGRFDIKPILLDFSYNRSSAICPYWVCFGSNGFNQEPAGLVTENFRTRGALNQGINHHVKSVVKGRQADLVDVSQNPHIFFTPYGSYDELGRLITHACPEWEPSHNIIRINHYVTQSREFFELHKMASGTALDPNPETTLKRHEDWWEAHNVNEFEDDSMDYFLPELKIILAQLPI